jgi:hypothetical protein
MTPRADTPRPAGDGRSGPCDFRDARSGATRARGRMPAVARKKSAAQLGREIAAAIARPPLPLPSAQPSPAAFPTLRVTRIYPERVDEWYHAYPVVTIRTHR